MRPGFRAGDIVMTPLLVRAQVTDTGPDGYELTYLDSQPVAGIFAGQTVALLGIHLKLYSAVKCAPAP